MTVLEKYNVSENEVKAYWRSMRVKEYCRQLLYYGESDMQLSDVEKAVFYIRYSRIF